MDRRIWLNEQTKAQINSTLPLAASIFVQVGEEQILPNWWLLLDFVLSAK